MGLAVVERNALLEQVWDLRAARDYVTIADLLGELPLEEHLREPDLGVTLCYAWYQLGELNKSIWLIRQLTEACERRGNTWLARRRMNNEALICLARGELDLAESLLHRLLLRVEEAGDIQLTSWVYNNLGILYFARGLYDFSLSHLRRSIATCQRNGDARHMSLCLLNMAAVYHATGALDKAFTCLQDAAEISRDVGSESELAHIEVSQAFAHVSRNDLPLARATANRAESRFIALGNEKGRGDALQAHGKILMMENRLPDAREYFMEALSLAQKSFNRSSEASLLADIGELHRRNGMTSDFLEFNRRSIALYKEIGNNTEADRLEQHISTMHKPKI